MSAADSLSNPSAWISRAPAAAFRRERLKVPRGLGVVVRALPTGGGTSCNGQPSESDVVHDHIRLRQHQIVAVACIGLPIGARHVEHACMTQRSETVGGSSGGSQLSPGRGSAEMINDGGPDANRQGSHQGRRREPAASGPSVGTSAAGPSGSDSMHQSESYRPVRRPRSSSRLGHGAPGSALLRLG